MNKVLTVIKKEVLDNIRDKRSLFFAIVYGPILMPLLMLGPLFAAVQEGQINFEKDTEVAIVGQSYAPNFIQFLKQKNIVAKEAPDNYLAKVKQGELSLVLEIPKEYPENLQIGKPAPLLVYFSNSDKDSTKANRQLKIIVDQYKNQLMGKRLFVRGFDPAVLEPIKLTEKDLSTEGVGGQIFGFLLPMVMIMSMMMGGMYLAIDSTAGERERFSLEPLLTLPMTRTQIVLGKYLAVWLFVVFSLCLVTLVMHGVISFMPMGELSRVFHFDGITLLKLFLLAIPLTFLIVSLLTLVSAYTKSTKEAQTHVGVSMIIPMAPMFILQFMKVKSSWLVMSLPMISQYKLMEKIVKDEGFPAEYILTSASGTLALALVLFCVTIWLYRRENIIG